jgi:thiol-disulfide isomerase/thioredoxin
MHRLRALGLVSLVATVAAGAIACATVVQTGSGAAPTVAQVGAPAPAVKLSVLDGGSADLAQDRGKVVLVNFWATWCEPCKAEMPGLQQLDQKLRSDSFVMYPVNMQEDGAAIAPFRKEIQFNLPVLMDENGAVTRSFGVRALPATFLIDRSGIVREQRLGPLVPGDANTPWSEAWVETRVRQLLEQ